MKACDNYSGLWIRWNKPDQNKNQINQQQQNPKNQNKTSFYSFYQFCFPTEIYKTTKSESIVPSKEGATGIQSQNLT